MTDLPVWIECVDCDTRLADEKASERHHKQLGHQVIHMPIPERSKRR